MNNHYQILTDRGPAAIAVVRLCGPGVPTFLAARLRFGARVDPAALQPGRVVRGALLDGEEPIDDALVSVHRSGPDWEARLHLHGGRWIVRRCAELLEAAGFVAVGPGGPAGTEARPTEAVGEEARPTEAVGKAGGATRAGGTGTGANEAAGALWPTANAIEAAAHALLPRMTTLAGAMGLLRQAKTLPAALDALREQEPGPVASAACRAIIERGAIFDWYAAPARVALVGPPNAGKSTLANALAGRAAALVSPTAGTTRDWLEIPAEIGGFPAAWLDTAGLRPTADPLETAGIERTHRVMAQADAVVFVLDGDPSAFDSQVAFAERYAADRPACVLLNKADDFDATRPALLELARRWPAPALPISAARGTGVAEFTALLLRSLGRERSDIDSASAFTARQREELGRAIAACEAADAAAFRAALDAILRQDPA